jgi:hypothetical protein
MGENATTGGFIFDLFIEAIAVIPVQDVRRCNEVLFEVIHEEGSENIRVRKGFGDFRFSSTRDGAGLMAEGAFGFRPNDSPRGGSRMSLHTDSITRWEEVSLAWQELDALGVHAIFPGNRLALGVEERTFWDKNEVVVFLVDTMTFRLPFDGTGEIFSNFLDGVLASGRLVLKFVT